MLVLQRKVNEDILIGDGIKIKVLSIKGDKVRLGFTAPAELRVDRAEVRARIDAELPPAIAGEWKECEE